MYSFKTKVRVRYAETDKMGYCYYGNYATYFEIARVEALRNLGVSYKVLEDEGTFLPVSEFNIKYLKPAYYDDELTIHVFIKEMPGVKIKFTYETYNDKDEKLNFGDTVLVFIDGESKSPKRPPEKLIKELNKYIRYE